MKTSEEIVMLTPANHVPGPRQGEWTYDSYTALSNEREVEAFLLEGDNYYSIGIFSGEQVIPSLIVPDLAIAVQRFFE